MVEAPNLGEAVLGRSGCFTSSVAQAECSYQCSADREHQSKEIRMFVGQQACFKTKYSVLLLFLMLSASFKLELCFYKS